MYKVLFKKCKKDHHNIMIKYLQNNFVPSKPVFNTLQKYISLKRYHKW